MYKKSAKLAVVAREDINFTGDSRVRSFRADFIVRDRFKDIPPLLLQFPTYQHLGWVQINPEYLEGTKYSRETGWFLYPVLSKNLKCRPEFFLVSLERNCDASRCHAEGP